MAVAAEARLLGACRMCSAAEVGKVYARPPNRRYLAGGRFVDATDSATADSLDLVLLVVCVAGYFTGAPHGRRGVLRTGDKHTCLNQGTKGFGTTL